MTLEEVFSKFLQKHAAASAIKTIGVGTAKDVDEHSCTVLRDGRPELHDVLFHAGEAMPGNYITEVPKEGSEVIYGIIDNQDTEAVIIKCSEIQKLLVKVGNTKYELTDAGHLIEKDNDTAAKVISDFIDEVMKIVVINGRSPSIPALTNIKTRLNKIFR